MIWVPLLKPTSFQVPLRFLFGDDLSVLDDLDDQLHSTDC